jgi:hypothetical protein
MLYGFDLGIGISFESFQSVGKTPVIKELLIMWVRGNIYVVFPQTIICFIAMQTYKELN